MCAGRRPLAVTLEVTLRREQLPALRGGGPLARLIATRAGLHDRDNDRGSIGRARATLPDDFLNFRYDPLAPAVAAGWNGAGFDAIPTDVALENDPVRMTGTDGGAPLRVAVSVDARAFDARWMDAVLRASGSGA